MRQGKWSEEQVIGILKQVERGQVVAEVCREHSVSQVTYYKRKSEYGGLKVNEARRFKQLEEENAKLKWLVTDLTLARWRSRMPSQKTGEARGQARSCTTLHEAIRLVAAAGL